MTKAGILLRFACRAALGMLAAAGMAHAAAPSRSATMLAARRDGVASYHLQARTSIWHIASPRGSRAFEGFVALGDTRPKHGSRAVDQDRFNWSPQVEKQGLNSSARRLVGAPFRLDALRVTVLGRRLILSHFTVTGKGVHGMISTAF